MPELTHSSLADLFTDIAEAIQAKTGDETPIVADVFPTAIAEIPTGSDPVLTTKTIDANGTYNAEDDNADGYNSVTVDVPTDKRVLYFTPSSNVSVVTLTHNLGAIPTHATTLATDPSPDGSPKLIAGTTKEDGSPGRIYGYKPDGTEYIGNTGFYISPATATSATFHTLAACPFRANVEYCFVISA